MTDLGPWVPLPLADVVELFAGAPLRWFITGGHALELHLGRSWRDHEDIDVQLLYKLANPRPKDLVDADEFERHRQSQRP